MTPQIDHSLARQPRLAEGEDSMDVPREGASLVDLFCIVRRRRLIVGACVVALPVIAVVLSNLSPLKYTATSHLLFRSPMLDQRFFGANSAAPQVDPTRQAATNLRLVQLSNAAARTAAQFPGVSSKAVAAEVSVTSEGSSDLVAVSATDRDRDRARGIANTYAQQFIASRREADVATIENAGETVRSEIAALPLSEKKSARARLLRDRADQLRTFAALQTGNAELTQQADVPTSASSPQPLRNGIVGVLVGLLLGVTLAVVRDRINRRVTSIEELETIYRVPLLGTVPLARQRSNPTAAPKQFSLAMAEAFQLVRVNLLYSQQGRSLKTVLVTSAEPADGKSTVAWNLAAAAAAAGTRALLIEADMRRPSLAAQHDLDAETVGLSDVLSGKASASEAVVTVFVGPAVFGSDESDAPTAPARPESRLDIVLTGRVPATSSDLFESPNLVRFLDEMYKLYDVIVIDSAPPTLVSDTILLGRLADGVIIVGRLNKTGRESSRRLARQMASLKFPLLGVVANCLASHDGGYGYGYRYGKGSRINNCGPGLG